MQSKNEQEKNNDKTEPRETTTNKGCEKELKSLNNVENAESDS